MIRRRVRIRYRKVGDSRWIGHRDFVRVWERLLRRAEAPVNSSEGYHPRPRIVFPSPLTLGMEGLDEVLEVELGADWSAEQLQASVLPQLPPGVELNSVTLLPDGSPKPQAEFVEYEFPVPEGSRAACSARLAELAIGAAVNSGAVNSGEVEFAATDSGGAPVEYSGGFVGLAGLEGLELKTDRIWFRLRVTPGETIKPKQVLAAVGLEALELEGLFATRVAVELETPSTHSKPIETNQESSSPVAS